MKYRFVTLLYLAILCPAVHARFSAFVHVAPGIENEHRSMPYSISTNPVLTISHSDTNTVIITIPLKETRLHQEYWAIRCTSPLQKEEHMDFRYFVWEYEHHKRWVQELEKNERLSPDVKSKLIAEHDPLKNRMDVESIERLIVSKENDHIVLEIPESEITRTYIFQDYPNMVMDGGYYYCFDLPAYYKNIERNQRVNPVEVGS